jgi:hypothetical protein
MDERITDKERTGQIAPPFSPHERALARAVAEAFYFFHRLTEMPARAADGSEAAFILEMGISRVLLARKGLKPMARRPSMHPEPAVC